MKTALRDVSARILAVLGEDQLRPAAVAKHIGMGETFARRMLKTMEAEGLVERLKIDGLIHYCVSSEWANAETVSVVCCCEVCAGTTEAVEARQAVYDAMMAAGFAFAEIGIGCEVFIKALPNGKIITIAAEGEPTTPASLSDSCALVIYADEDFSDPKIATVNTVALALDLVNLTGI